VLPPGADAEAVVTEVAKLAVCGRAGTEVIQVTAPDITEVTSLGVRASDRGASTGGRTRNATARPGPPGRRTADPHRRRTDRAAARHRRAGAGDCRADRAERRAARRRGHDGHRRHGDDRGPGPGKATRGSRRMSVAFQVASEGHTRMWSSFSPTPRPGYAAIRGSSNLTVASGS
jgi:hypothetical protein